MTEGWTDDGQVASTTLGSLKLFLKTTVERSENQLHPISPYPTSNSLQQVKQIEGLLSLGRRSGTGEGSHSSHPHLQTGFCRVRGGMDTSARHSLFSTVVSDSKTKASQGWDCWRSWERHPHPRARTNPAPHNLEEHNLEERCSLTITTPRGRGRKVRSSRSPSAT